MKNSIRVICRVGLCATITAMLAGCSRPTPPPLVLAPPGPAELGPASGLSTPPEGAIVFDLKYLPQTGRKDDIEYHSYWGYGGSNEETKTNSFLEEVRKKAPRLHYVSSSNFKDRKWAAVEYEKKQALAFYFDLNADGKLADNERISPTRNIDTGFDFITPDFMQTLEDGRQTLCRAVLRVNFYSGNSEPNCMWSPGALLDGTATLNGESTRLLLYASGPGGQFDKFGSSDYSFLAGKAAQQPPGSYIPRQTLSSLICNAGQFYHLTVEGRRSNGLPARVVLVADTTPTGFLTVKMAGSNALQASVSWLNLHGVDDKTVFLNLENVKGKVTLPEGAYALDNGSATYGMTTNARDWEVSFSQGPCATIKGGEVFEVVLGQPELKVRAVDERNRYDRGAAESTTFKKGNRIYLEPKITGKGNEVFSRFRQGQGGRGDKSDRPPKITITGSDGKQLLASTMEYG